MLDEELRADFIEIKRIGRITNVYIRVISWPVPWEPVSRWTLYKSIDSEVSDPLLDSIINEILTNPKYFKICLECNQKHPVGHMGAEICHTCQENNHGVVH